MKRSKKVFLLVAILFIGAILVVSYDISRKTSFPGSKKYLKESIAPSEQEDTTTVVKKEEKIEEERKEN